MRTNPSFATPKRSESCFAMQCFGDQKTHPSLCSFRGGGERGRVFPPLHLFSWEGTLRLEAIALRLEAIASRLEAIASRLEAIALWLGASLLGWRPSLLG